MVEQEKGTEYVVLARDEPEQGWREMKEGQSFTTESKEAAVRAAFLSAARHEVDVPADCEFKAVPMSSWRDTFEIDPDPRVRRKR